MAYGFATWDASGTDNNTGLVKINALGAWQVAAGATGSQSFSLPTGYTLDFLVQTYGDLGSARKKITASGNTITVTSTTASDYSAGTYPDVGMAILAYAR
ncbi:hypothetical protein PUG81_01590 [Erwiniaceae bacterium L1_54_6]|nr:hypothetical protein [Erwiniaceae bacterium L1_54_6]